MNTKKIVKRIPILGPVSRKIRQNLFTKPFHGSERYWIERYATGGNSGAGSYSKLAEYKAEVLNDFVKENNVKSVIEYGCGDGSQLKLAVYPNYIGFDIAPKAIALCRELFRSDSSKNFKLMEEYEGERAELTLSLDVIFHLVEDEVFESYMKRLFGSSDRFVIIYSSDSDTDEQAQKVAPHVKRKKLTKWVEVAPHVKHRKFTKWVEKNLRGWELIQHIPNKYPFTGDPNEGSFADFYIYKKK